MHPSHGFCRLLRWGMLALGLLAGAAHADDYAPVTELMRTGQLQQAMARVQQHLATKPRDPQMRFLKGLIEQDSGKPQDAIATYNLLIQDYPELPEPYNNVAVLYAAQGQYDRARQALEMAIRTNSQYAIAHENLGDVYARLAHQAYLQSQRLDANNPSLAPKLNLLRQLFSGAASR
jgi:tetratricopeptide (TPR) repeat protein